MFSTYIIYLHCNVCRGIAVMVSGDFPRDQACDCRTRPDQGGPGRCGYGTNMLVT